MPDQPSYRVLVVEADPDWQTLLELHLATQQRRLRVDTTVVGSIDAALAEVLDGYDVAVVDLALPGAPPAGVLRTLHAASPELPMVVLTDDLGSDAAATVRDGASDTLAKSEVSGPLLARSLLLAIERKNRELDLVAVASTDALTGLGNRRRLTEEFPLLIGRVDRRGGSLMLALFDVDRFKQINDAWGHLTGDEVLQAIGTRIVGAIRPTDVGVRLGGDEFAVVSWEPEGVADWPAMLGRIHDGLNVAPFQTQDRAVSTGVSLGAAVTERELPFDDLYRAADSALYEAKRNPSLGPVIRVV